MDYEWDDAKSERTRRDRGLPFELAVLLFDGPIMVRVDDRIDYGEVRLLAVGDVGGVVLTCVYTEKGDRRRIISLRRASRKERDAYHSTVPR
ncbi:MAG TPA: BrnT family toxin [Caulobacteraceae bacterium]|nr:BrnT family toxin [Caulobacteraceae bacterium]